VFGCPSILNLYDADSFFRRIGFGFKIFFFPPSYGACADALCKSVTRASPLVLNSLLFPSAQLEHPSLCASCEHPWILPSSLCFKSSFFGKSLIPLASSRGAKSFSPRRRECQSLGVNPSIPDPAFRSAYPPFPSGVFFQRKKIFLPPPFRHPSEIDPPPLISLALFLMAMSSCPLVLCSRSSRSLLSPRRSHFILAIQLFLHTVPPPPTSFHKVCIPLHSPS